MTSYLRALSSEWVKLSRSPVWLLIILSPALALVIGVKIDPGNQDAWLILFAMMSQVHALLFLPILTGVFGSFVCRYEHTGGGWKKLLVMPLSRTGLYFAKFTVICLLLAAVQILFTGAVLAAGIYHGVQEPLAWDLLLRSVVGGWIACLPLAALQLGVSTWWSSFAAPLALNVIFTVPGMLIVNSATYGPWYPWVQPVLSMLPREQSGYDVFNLPSESLMFVVIGGFLLFFSVGWLYFLKREH